MTNPNEAPHPSRRSLLKTGLGGALALGAIGADGTVLARNMLADPTPGVTEGPYWVDELLFRSDVRADPTTGVMQVGLPLQLAVTVSSPKKNGKTVPLRGAIVDIWHTNAQGVYSDEESEGTVGQKFLRGFQVSNAKGLVRFQTIYPGWYQGRTVHIHLRVRVLDAATNTITYNFVTQMFFRDAITNQVYASTAPYAARPARDTTNANDGIFNGESTDGTVDDVGPYLLLKLARSKKAATGTFNVVIDLTDAANNNASGGSGGGPAGGVPPGGGPPPGM